MTQQKNSLRKDAVETTTGAIPRSHGVERETWVSMAIAAATRSVRNPQCSDGAQRTDQHQDYD